MTSLINNKLFVTSQPLIYKKCRGRFPCRPETFNYIFFLRTGWRGSQPLHWSLTYISLTNNNFLSVKTKKMKGRVYKYSSPSFLVFTPEHFTFAADKLHKMIEQRIHLNILCIQAVFIAGSSSVTKCQQNRFLLFA